MNQYQNTGDLPRFLENQTEPSWFAQFRHQAYEAFKASQWPQTQDEEWRRSDISAFELDSLAFQQSQDTSIEVGSSGPDSAGSIHFRNGKVLKLEHSSLPEGLVFQDLSTFLKDPARQAGTDPVSKALREGLEQAMANADNKIYHWSLAAASYGVVLYLPKNQVIDQPFQIEFSSDSEDMVELPFVALILEEGAKATVHLRWRAEVSFLINQNNLFVVKDAAVLDFALLQECDESVVAFCNGKSLVSRDAKFRHFEAILGGGFVKHRIDSSLVGPGSDLELDGLYFADAERHVDLRTVQHHDSHHAVSNAIYRGAVAEEAHTIYQGLIEVSPGAPGTDAYLSNKNLILNDGARADSIPCLQINTDDVRCSHGSTTGRLRPDQIFYLMSRGYSREEAKEELILAYFQEVLERVHPSIREEIMEELHRQIAAVEIQVGA